MGLFDEAVEPSPQVFPLAKLSELKIALKVGGQIVERRQKSQAASLGARRGDGTLKNFKDSQRPEVDG